MHLYTQPKQIYCSKKTQFDIIQLTMKPFYNERLDSHYLPRDKFVGKLLT